MLATFESKKFVFACLTEICFTLMIILKSIPADRGLEFIIGVAGIYLAGQSVVDIANGIKNRKKTEEVKINGEKSI